MTKPETVRRLASALQNALAQLERKPEKARSRDENYTVQNGNKVLNDYYAEERNAQ